MSFCTAASLVMPTTFGMGNSGGPSETTIATVFPGWSSVPLGGSCEITAPRGTSSEKSCVTAYQELLGMLTKGRGSIINIASAVGASKAAPNRYVYGATKAAVVGLTKAVAMDFIGKGIRCNCICPGTIQTPSLDERVRALGRQVGGEEKARAMFIERQPMGRLGTAEEMAHIAVYLASDESVYTTGSAFLSDGGFTL